MTGTYGDMQARIADELLTGASITSAQIKLEILSAIRHYERQRFWFNEGQATLTTTAAQITANSFPPTDLLEIDSIDIVYSTHPYALQRRDWQWYTRIGGRDTTVGRAPPDKYIYYGDTLYLYPVPDNTYNLQLSYLKQLAVLSADGDTNSWMTDGEELIRNRARQAVKINYGSDDGAKGEAALMAQMNEPYLSSAEKIAHQSLVRAGIGRISTGRLVPTRF